jgi:hypothetical protein
MLGAASRRLSVAPPSLKTPVIRVLRVDVGHLEVHLLQERRDLCTG